MLGGEGEPGVRLRGEADRLRPDRRALSGPVDRRNKAPRRAESLRQFVEFADLFAVQPRARALAFSGNEIAV